MQHDQNDIRPVSNQADPTSTPTITPSTPHPLAREHVLNSERQSENAVFSQERSPVELEIEKGFDTMLPGRSPGWATRSL